PGGSSATMGGSGRGLTASTCPTLWPQSAGAASPGGQLPARTALISPGLPDRARMLRLYGGPGRRGVDDLSKDGLDSATAGHGPLMLGVLGHAAGQDQIPVTVAAGLRSSVQDRW